MMDLDQETRNALNNLFGALWGNRGGVSGSWGASSFRYHPTFIRRGPLLLTGETTFSQLYILNPPDAKVTPIPGNSCANCNVFPGVDGEAIKIWEHDDGPWWNMVRQELPKMQAELEEHLEAKKREVERERKQARDARASELAKAREAVEASRPGEAARREGA